MEQHQVNVIHSQHFKRAIDLLNYILPTSVVILDATFRYRFAWLDNICLCNTTGIRVSYLTMNHDVSGFDKLTFESGS
jgi:hypothetical protein